MTDKELLVPSMPGAEDVTDGSVDHHEMDWPVIDNRATEDEMYKCTPVPCGGDTACQDNQPRQTDEEFYEIIPG